MGFDECYQLGTVVKTHGLRGEVVFSLDVDFPEDYKELESVFIDINGKLVPFFIESFRLQGDRAIVVLEDITTLEAAESLSGKGLYLPLENLPRLSAGQYYYHELVGLDVYENDQLLGKVTEVFQMPTNYLLGVDHKGTEVLIPLEDEIIISVDLEHRKIITKLPEGLLDVYLDQ